MHGLAVYLGLAAIYGAAMGDRLLRPSIYNHYTYLADALLHGQLELTHPPPHQNDWAAHEGRWYVSFPPVPALLMMPGVALWGWESDTPSPVPEHWQRPGTSQGRYQFHEPLFVLLFAPLPPLLLLLILDRLRRSERSRRGPREDLLLVSLFALGTVYFPTAVQADTWHIAHVVGMTFLGLSVLAGLEGRHPTLAALTLGLAFGSRTPMLFAFPLFFYELARAHGVTSIAPLGGKLRAMTNWAFLWRALWFGLVLSALVGLWLAMNEARFGDPFDFGHRHLQVRWLPRIERWGLFDLHYLSRNLAAALVLLPWFVEEPPYFRIGQHGLAIWVTTPALLALLWSRRRAVERRERPPRSRSLWPQWRADLHLPLWICVAAVAAPSLLYQNTGWIQFGYRFSNDYMLFFMMLLALGDRPFTRSFRALVVLSIASPSAPPPSTAYRCSIIRTCPRRSSSSQIERHLWRPQREKTEDPSSVTGRSP